MASPETKLQTDIAQSRGVLDAWVREVIQWHFDPATGTPFWLDYAARAGWDPRREVRGYADLDRFGSFDDEWLRVLDNKDYLFASTWPSYAWAFNLAYLPLILLIGKFKNDGPSSTTKMPGNTHSTIGKSIFTGAFWASSWAS